MSEIISASPPEDTPPDPKGALAAPKKRSRGLRVLAWAFGSLVVVLLLISLLFLVRSMNRHLKKLPESFDPQHPEPDQAVDDGTIHRHPDDRPPHEPGG